MLNTVGLSPLLTVCAVFDAPQDVVSSLGCQETQLPHTESATGQYPQTLFCRPALQTLLSQFVSVFCATLS